MVHPYIEELERCRLQREKEDAQRKEEKRAAKLGAARERLTPLDDRLARLLATIPEEMKRDEGLSLPTLQKSLRGRWRGNCHPGELGEALRRLGFKRQRHWRDGAPLPVRWYLTG